ncbi:G-protein coupled receptor 98 [Clarias magur]|uniref:G-protein coupled receptor 98 n=1 Tax=Clarias magur TaxID=1594786 RepID=A0A8J4UHI7_CLAMG|nr:G-protein coupled receptor 98 [Clarias magur]
MSHVFVPSLQQDLTDALGGGTMGLVRVWSMQGHRVTSRACKGRHAVGVVLISS